MNRDYYEVQKPSWMMRFLWPCAGADRYLLEKATYTDQVKYMCLGGIVLATGVLAGLAGGYAFYTIFAPKTSDVLDKTKTLVENTDYVGADTMTTLLAIGFGIAWGLMIFNIDRFIVTSTGKGDGTEKITWDEFKSAIPRIIMGMIIAITISKPVEIRMFKTEIDLEIKMEQDKKKEEGIDQAKKNYAKKREEINQQTIATTKKIDQLDSLINYLTIEIKKEVRGEQSSVPGEGARAKAIQSQKTQLQDEKNRLLRSSEYTSAIAEENRLRAEYTKDIADAEKKAATLDGLLIRIKKAHEIAGTWITLFITLLFMAIELTPIFFKLMLTKTPYDYLSENRDELIKAEHGIETRYDYYKDKFGQERHLTINHQAEKILFEKTKIIEVQKELSGHAIAKYRDQEIAKIDQNPADYVQVN
ncbi:DUF4407 domain-containing protein [Dyadobacter chenhuakuii]|uniref:DUF4407 domain-containing protein n=1 Tax=Dyadobacter chenhuakuii TaxID=2909339 RepID=A0A9X1TVI2_9BACT|nr:DUF4407 domain-containing protein [Dyadobacter chenhuakuii]MCF2500423.1 DUF4407 domain-containing protein [Dyadobacter chenhuakuii]